MSESETKDSTLGCKPVLRSSSTWPSTYTEPRISDSRVVNGSYVDLSSAVRLAVHKAAVLGFLRRQRTDCKYYFAYAMATNRFRRKCLKNGEHKPPTYTPAINGYGPLLAKKGNGGTLPTLIVNVKSPKGRQVPQKAKTSRRWLILPLGTRTIKPTPPPPPPTPSTSNSGCLSKSSLASSVSLSSHRCFTSRASLHSAYRNQCGDARSEASDIEGCSGSASMDLIENGCWETEEDISEDESNLLHESKETMDVFGSHSSDGDHCHLKRKRTTKSGKCNSIQRRKQKKGNGKYCFLNKTI